MVSHARPVLHQLRDLIGTDPDRFARNVYSRLFTIDPDLRELFGASLTAQQQAFYHVIDHVLEVIPDPQTHEALVDFLAQLGRDHRKFGVLPEHYHAMFTALMGEFEKLLGPYWDAEAQRDIGQAMMLVTGVMRGAAEMTPGPPTWHAQVVEKFRISRDLAVVRLRTDAPLRFNTGQYVETQIPQWPKLWRNLSPAIPPNPHGELEFHVRAVPNGHFGPAIVGQTQVGDIWTFGQTHGTLHIDRDREVLMVAGGTGLAPLRALLIEMSARADSPPTHVFYGTRHPGELYDLPMLRQMTTTNPWLRVTAVSEESTDPWWLRSGVSPSALGVEHRLGRLVDIVATGQWHDHQTLIAGSPQMVENTRRGLIASGVRSSLIQHDPLF